MVNFEDQDWEELGAQARRGALEAANAWKIVAGVAIGVLLGGGLVYLVDHGMLQRALSDAARVIQQTVRVAGPASVIPPKSTASVAEQLATQQDMPDPASAVPVPPAPPAAASAGGAPAAESTQRAMQEAAEQKERAWAKYYKKPAQCDGSPGRDTIVECANHFIRARREFDAAYAAGRR
jgi:hypothetical protein